MGAWRSKIPEVTRKMEGNATRSALKAAGEVVVEELRERIAPGFTSGDFSTGKLAKNSVKRVRPTPKRQRIVTGNPVLIAWTLGHHNVFTQRFERVDYFTAVLRDKRTEIARAFADRYKEKLVELIHKARLT